MGVVEKRAKHKEQFRREILDSAREIFINDGYDGFSMRKLAERIGYSPTTIYLYFKNKDDLLLAICEEFYADLLARLNHIRSVSRDPVETLRQAILYLMEFGIRNPNQYKMIFFTKSMYGSMDEWLKNESMARNTYLVFREMVRDCITAGRLREADEEVIAPALATASHGLMTVLLYRPDCLGVKSDVMARSLVDALLRGFQK